LLPLRIKLRTLGGLRGGRLARSTSGHLLVSLSKRCKKCNVSRRTLCIRRSIRSSL
jgi:hypothetical protein